MEISSKTIGSRRNMCHAIAKIQLLGFEEDVVVAFILRVQILKQLEHHLLAIARWCSWDGSWLFFRSTCPGIPFHRHSQLTLPASPKNARGKF